MQLKTRALHHRFGVEVLGVALNVLDGEAVDALRNAWQQHPLVLLRRQFLTEGELVALAGCFGELHRPERPNNATPRLSGVMYVSNLKTEAGERIGGLGSSELDWHSDQSYRKTPATGSIFHAIEMPEGAGRIHWCNTQLAYEALAPDLKERIASLRAVSRYNAYERENIGDEEKRRLRDRHPPVSHPMVLTHPASGEKCLYLDISTAYAVEGLAESEARALLDQLTGVMTRAEFVYTHEWRPGDVMLWDNSRLCHRRDGFPGHHPRLGKRVSVFLDPALFPRP